MRVLSGIISFLILTMPASGQDLSVSVDRYLKKMNENHVMPGFSVVLVKDGKVLSKGYGLERTGAEKLITPTSVMAIGSLTKSFTALAVMKLVERGKIDLDSPVTTYLSWFRTLNKDQSDKITIKMLLNNTSGLYSPVATPLYDLSDNAAEQYVRKLSSIFLYKTPGNSYEYNNTGFVVAGLVISTVTENSYASFLEREIFKPLNMTHTTLRPDEFARLKSVPGHYPSIKGTIVANREPEFETGEYAAAGSLLHSNANDLGKYLFTYLNTNSFLSRKSRDLLWTRYIDFPGLAKEDGGDGKRYSYGLGWMISEIEGRTIIHHGGSTGKTSSFMMIDTVNKIAAAILMNLDLTFIDKHTYATGFQILNNIMRLASNLEVSGFGRPVLQDRTRNTYELSVNKERNYIGEYIHSEGGDGIVYFGVDMSIRKNDEGQLEGVIHRGKQVVNRFNVDYVNQSVAVSRNINSPEYIRFRITAAGDITHIYFRNIEFKKKPSDEGRVHELKGVYGSVSFRLPYTWAIKSKENFFSAANEQNRILISGGETGEKNLSIRKFFAESLPMSARIVAESKVMTENIGSLVWQQQMYSMKEGKVDYLRMVVFTRTSKSAYWFMLTAPKNQFSVAVQDVLRPLLLSLRVL